MLITAAHRLEEVRDGFALPAAFLVQGELEETDQVEVVLLQEALLNLGQAHPLYLRQSARAIRVDLDAKDLQIVL